VPAERYSAAPDYVEVNQAAIRRMFRQVGPLRCDAEGIAHRGLCIRHLLLPSDQSASRAVLAFLKNTFDPQDVTISLMAQYRPFYKSERYPPISGCLTPAEYGPIKAAFVGAGFGGFYQEPERLDTSFCIDFKKRKEEPLTGE
jgi:putative pyruvate formate lyase activating enzyme